MSTKLKNPVDKSERGFEIFVRYTLFECNQIIREFERPTCIQLVDPKDYALAKRITDLYDKVKERFTVDEHNAVDFLMFRHNKSDRQPEYYVESIRLAYRKWQLIFFPRGITAVYKKINYDLLGKILKSYRKSHGYSRDCIARCTGVSNRTLEKYEKGITPPSLDFLNIFCQIFDCSFNELFFDY